MHNNCTFLCMIRQKLDSSGHIIVKTTSWYSSHLCYIITYNPPILISRLLKIRKSNKK